MLGAFWAMATLDRQVAVPQTCFDFKYGAVWDWQLEAPEDL